MRLPITLYKNCSKESMEIFLKDFFKSLHGNLDMKNIHEFNLMTICLRRASEQFPFGKIEFLCRLQHYQLYIITLNGETLFI